jgi:hypothetical protein
MLCDVLRRPRRRIERRDAAPGQNTSPIESARSQPRHQLRQFELHVLLRISTLLCRSSARGTHPQVHLTQQIHDACRQIRTRAHTSTVRVNADATRAHTHSLTTLIDPAHSPVAMTGSSSGLAWCTILSLVVGPSRVSARHRASAWNTSRYECACSLSTECTDAVSASACCIGAWGGRDARTL